jgi:FG-GAP-like repeat
VTRPTPTGLIRTTGTRHRGHSARGILFIIRETLAALVLALTLAACSHASPPTDLLFAVGAGPGSVAIGDFNGDGNLDIVTANEQGGDASVLLGDGKGAFSPAAGSPFRAGSSPNDIVVGDFNLDGRLDLAFANHDTQYLTVLDGDGRGGFAPAPLSPFAVAVKPHPHGIATGDFDGDGRLDLVTDSWAEERLEILPGDARVGFATPGSYVAVGRHPYQRIRVADLDGDGLADIVSTNLEGDDVTILLGDGKGGFSQPKGSPFPCGDSPFNVAIGDVNADGLPDLAIVNSPSSTSDRSGRDGLTLLIGDGRGGFTRMTGSPLVTAERPNMVAIGDVNGDGVGDIVVSIPDGDAITVFLMDRKGSVASRSTLPVHGHPKGLAIRDLNADGKGDIVITNNAQNSVTVRLGE